VALNGLFCADVPLRNYSLTHLVFLCLFVVQLGARMGQADGRTDNTRNVACQKGRIIVELID